MPAVGAPLSMAAARVPILGSAQHMHHALAVRECVGQRSAQGLVLGRHIEAGHGQLDGVFLKRSMRGKLVVGRKLPSPQVRVAAWAGPVGQLGVTPLRLTTSGASRPMCWPRNCVSSCAAMLSGVCGCTAAPSCTQCCVPSLTYSRRKSATPRWWCPRWTCARRATGAAQSPRWADAVHRIHLGPACGLHDAAGVGVEAFEVAALAFVEQDVERQRGLARAADAGDDVELATRNVHAQALEVVLFGVDDLNGVLAKLPWRLSFLRKAAPVS